MNQSASIEILNRLLAVEYRSLPVYLSETCPWISAADQTAKETLDQIVADKQHYASRLAEMILNRNEQPDPGSAHMEYTDLHLLAMDYLVRILIDDQKQGITEVESCIAELYFDREARALAEEILGNEQGHLEALEALAKLPA